MKAEANPNTEMSRGLGTPGSLCGSFGVNLITVPVLVHILTGIATILHHIMNNVPRSYSTLT